MTAAPALLEPPVSMDELHRRVARADYQRWQAHIIPAAGCAHPVRLHGLLHTVEPTTGRIVTTVST